MVPKYPSTEMYSCSNVPCRRIHMPKSSSVESPNAEKSPCRNFPVVNICGAEKYPCRKIHVMKCLCRNVSRRNVWYRNKPKPPALLHDLKGFMIYLAAQTKCPVTNYLLDNFQDLSFRLRIQS